MNKVMLVGNLTRDAEVRETTSGFPITEMGIAVNERRKNNETGQWDEKPHFFDLKMLGDRGQKVAQYLTKGTKVAVLGRLEYRQWENQAGEKRSKVEVLIEDIEFMSSRDSGSRGGSGGGYEPSPAPAPRTETAPAPSTSDGGEIPF